MTSVEARLEAIESEIATLKEQVAAPVMVDGDALNRQLHSLFVSDGIIRPADDGLQSDDGQQQLSQGVVRVDCEAPLGADCVEEVATDREVLGQVPGDLQEVGGRVVVAHGDSSSVGPDGATSGDAPTVEEGGGASAVEGDSSGGRVTDEDGAKACSDDGGADRMTSAVSPPT